MNSLIYIFKISLYFILLAFIYFWVKKDYILYKNLITKQKIGVPKMVVISSLVALYAIYSFPSEWRGDHFFFYHRFTNYISIEHESVGLNFLFDIIHIFTNNPYIMFFTVIFIGTLLVLISYRQFENATPIALILLLSSEYFLYGFAALKQFLANGFAFLFFASFFRKKHLFSILFIILSILFHEVGYVLIIFYFLLLLSKKVHVFLVSAILVVVPFVYNFLINLAILIFPELASHLSIYLGDSGQLITSENFLTILKGAPVYIICLFAIVKYKTYSKQIKNYNLYLLCAISASVWILMSFNMYWFFRISYLFLFPTFILAENIYKPQKGTNDGVIFKVGVFGVLIALTLRYMLQMFFKYNGL